MDNTQLNQYRMVGAVDKLLGNRAGDLAPSPVAEREAADVRAAYAALGKVMGGTPSATQDVTQGAGTQRLNLEKILPALTGPLQSHARKTNDTALLAAATLRVRQFTKLRPPQLRNVVTTLLGHATTHAAALAPYGFTAAVRTRFDEVLAAFSATVGATQDLIDQRQGANASADELLAELMQQLYELDEPMEIFRLLNPDLHRSYRLARRIGKSGGRSKGNKGDTPSSPQS